MMRFAVITDIHGNAPALRAVLNKIDHKHDVEHIFCLGDMIALGPDTNEVLEMLFERNDISLIKGNHEEAVFALINGEEHPKRNRIIKDHHQWIAERLDPQFIPKISKLPRFMKRKIENKTFLFIHYHMRREKMSAHISQDPYSPIVDPTLENMEKLFEDYEEDCICFGHHHPCHYFRNDTSIYLNPGALGCNHQAIAPYAIVSVENGKIDINIEHVEYSKKDFLDSYEKLQVPARDFILKIFHGYQVV